MSRLYLVATPIGNLEDLSYRAVRILKEVPLIAAEDTRTTRVLLNHYGIETELTPYHDHNKERAASQLLEHLQGADLALVSDAGTPAINDPGFYLVQAAVQAGHEVLPIPGPSAPIAALSASGLATDSFLYLGYLPRKKASRRDLLASTRDLPWTLVFLETPHRLVESLADLQASLGDRRIAVARELTKLHEEIYRGVVSAAHQHFQEKEPKGEITLVIEGKTGKEIWSDSRMLEAIREARGTSASSPSQVAKALAKKSGWPRSRIYDLMQALDDEN
ncbi:MAG: 16S rRNA (cytidine(1402)-2'-O)-methyltransferase [Anaerolineales bacterium]